MQLQLEVTAAGSARGSGPVTVDVVVTIEPDHRVGELVDALVDRLGLIPDPDRCLSRPGTGEVFDRAELIGGIGLTTGDALHLGPSETTGSGASATPSVGPCLMVTGGPDAGLAVPLPPRGRLIVGRDRQAGLCLTDPGIGRADLRFDWTPAGPPRVLLGPGVKVRVDGLPVASRTRLAPGRSLRLADTTLELRARNPAAAPPDRSTPNLALRRTSPTAPGPVPFTVEAPAPPTADGEAPSFPYLAVLAPVGLGVALALLYSPRFLLFAALSPVVAVAAFVDQRRRNRRRRRQARARFDDDLDRCERELAAALVEERARRLAVAPDTARLLGRVDGRSAALWPRGPTDPRVLELRIGSGPVTPLAQAGPIGDGDPEDLARVEERLAPLRTLHDVPLVVDLPEAGALAVVGPRWRRGPVLANLMAQTAALHPPRAVQVVVATGDAGPAAWAHWLPHAHPVGAVSAPDPARTGGDGPAEARSDARSEVVADVVAEIVADVVAEVRARRSRSGRVGAGPAVRGSEPWLVVVVDDGAEPADPASAEAAAGRVDPADVAELVMAGPEVGVLVIVGADPRAPVPPGVGAVLTLPSAGAGSPTLALRRDGAWSTTPVAADGLDADRARVLARRLAPLVAADTPAGQAALPTVVPLARALRALDDEPEQGARPDDAGSGDAPGPAPTVPDGSWVVDRWRRAPPGQVAVPVGWGPAGPFTVDLVLDGPHCLIGGTSGSGKSELVSSMVAGMAACNPPHRLQMLFVDYKGGATSEAFADLPHTAGSVTNLDEALAERALISLSAELNRRMALLRGRARDVGELLASNPDDAPPALVIVIDEFATLVAEIPAFVAGLVDIAQRGRSLGIHLLLATQRPAAAVSDDILANTNLRLCLRTVDAAESNAVLGLPDAGAIPVSARGRGVARLGAGDPIPFQSAWSGAPLPGVRTRAVPTVAPARPVDESRLMAGRPRRVGPGRPGSSPPAPARPPGPGGSQPAPAVARDSRGDVQLTALVAAVVDAADRLGLPSAPPPWREELPRRLRWADLEPVGPGPDGGLTVTLGLADVPHAQAQHPARIDLSATGGLLILGAGGSGRTTVLRTVAAELERRPPATVSEVVLGPGPGPDAGTTSASSSTPVPVGARPLVVGFDFASGDLASVEVLGCCAEIAAGDDLEAVTRLIADLEQELERRRSAARARSSPSPVPIVLLIDDLGALTAAFEGAGVPTAHHAWLERLHRVVAEGRPLGLLTVATGSRRAVFRPPIWNAVSARLLLRSLDASAGTDLGLSRRQPGPPPTCHRGAAISTAPP